MQTITQAVWGFISTDAIAFEYLKKGLLNASAYADQIKPEIENRLMLKVTSNSIVTALSRIRQNFKLVQADRPKFKIDDLSFKLPIIELVYYKNQNPNPALAKIYEKLEKMDDLHLNIVNVTNELDIFISADKAATVKSILTDFDLMHEEKQLSAIILKYDSKYRNYVGMGSQILNALAISSITIIECLTTYTGFIIYINQIEANKAIEILSHEFI
jgi:hypothetical protein